MRKRLLVWLGDRIQRHRVWVVALLCVLFGFSVYWVATGHLKINTSRHGLVNEDDPEQMRLMAYHERFGAANDVAIVFELSQDTPEERTQVRAIIEQVAERLQASANFHQLFYRVNFRLESADTESEDALGTRGLYYLPMRYFERIRDNVTLTKQLLGTERNAGSSKTVRGIVQATKNLVKGLDDIDANDGAIDTSHGLDTQALSTIHPVELYPLLNGIRATVDELRLWVDEPKRNDLGFQPERPQTTQGFQLDDEGYVVSADRQLYLVKLSIVGDAVDYKVARPVLDEVRTIVGEAVDANAPIEWGITGVPVSVIEEREAIEDDLPMTTAISIVGCLLVFLIAYRSLRYCGVAFLPILVGLACALALTALVVGSLNLLTSPCFVILIGMGIDFAIHLITRVREERRQGHSPLEATQIGLQATGPAILTGAVTSAAAFAALAFTDLRATSELGITTAMGLITVLVVTLVIVPLLLGNERMGGRTEPTSSVSKMPVFVRTKRSALAVFLGILAVSVALVWMIRPIHFEFDINEYLPANAESISVMNKLTEHGIQGIEYAVVQADTLKDSEAQHKALIALESSSDLIDRVASIFDVMPENLDAKTEVVQDFRKANLPRLLFAPDPEGSSADFVQALDALRTPTNRPTMGSFRLDLPYILDKNFNFSRPEVCQSDADCQCDDGQVGCKRGLVCRSVSGPTKHCTLDREPFERLQSAVDGLYTSAAAVHKADPKALRLRLDRFEKKAAEISVHLNQFFHDDPIGLNPQDLPTSIRSTFYVKDKAGKETFAIRVYPRNFVEPAQAKRLASAMTKIDPEATGYALVYHYFGGLMQRGFRNGAIWAGFAVLFLVLLDLRSIRDSLIALIPLVVGGLWMVGFMNVLGIDYSFANVISIPLIVGIGIDSGIHLIHRWRETLGDIDEAVRSTGKAITVSSVTTMFAFGTLSLVAHRGAQSLGMVLVLGVGSCLIMSLLLLPALIHLFSIQPRAVNTGSE